MSTVSADNEPRHLTVEEINYILDGKWDEDSQQFLAEPGLPLFTALTDEIAEHNREQVRQKLVLQLLDLKICPDAHDELRLEIRKQHFRSLLDAGEPVGIRAAEGFGAPITQSALSSFHQSGSSASVTTGIEAVRELYNVSQNRKHPTTIIHFKNKNLTFEEVIDLRRQIVGVTVRQLIKMEEMLDASDFVEPWWYAVYNMCQGDVEFPPIKHYVLRLHVNVNSMYAYHITMKEICDTITNESNGIVFCIPSPVCDGIIDIIPTSTEYKGTTICDNFEDANLHLCKLQILSKSLIGTIISERNRIRGITQIFPMVAKTASVFSHSESYYDSLSKNIQSSRQSWQKVWLDPIRLRLTGIPITKIVSLFRQSGITIHHAPAAIHDLPHLDGHDDRHLFVVELPKQMTVPMKLSDYQSNQKDLDKILGSVINYPTETSSFITIRNTTTKVVDYIQSLLQIEEILIKKQLKILRREKSMSSQKISELYRSGHYVYAMANGTNLRGVLAHRLLDPNLCTCNNFYEMAAVLGIEAVRNSLVLEITDIIAQNDSYVTHCHVQAIAAFQTSLGYLLPITSDGVVRKNVGAFALSSYDRSMERFISASVAGKKEHVRSTSTAIFVGHRMKLGTGAFDIAWDQQALDEAGRRETERQTDDRPVEALIPSSSNRRNNNYISGRDDGDSSDEDNDDIISGSDLKDFAEKWNPPMIVKWKSDLIRPSVLTKIFGELSPVPSRPTTPAPSRPTRSGFIDLRAALEAK